MITINNLNVYIIFVVMLFIIGLYYIIATTNLFRALMGIEIMIKSVTLFIVVVGNITNNIGLAQTFVITIIVIEVVLTLVGAGIVLNIYKNNNSLNIENIRNLKG